MERGLLENALQKEDYRDAYYQLRKASEYSGGQFADMDALIYDATHERDQPCNCGSSQPVAPPVSSARWRRT